MNKIIHSYKEISPKELNEAKKISKAFNTQFWKKVNKLNNPLMKKEDYLDVFKTVSEILARIRCALHINYTLTGNASNYLMQMSDHPEPNEEFMRTIVHEALKDSKGYILKCNKENIDSFINDHLNFVKKNAEKRAQDKKNKVNKLKESWEEVINNMGEILKEKENIQQSYSELFLEDTSTNEPFIIEIVERLGELNESLVRFKNFQHKRKLKKEKKEKMKKVKTSSDNTPKENSEVKEETNESISENNVQPIEEKVKNNQTENNQTENNQTENNQNDSETIQENVEPQEDPNQKEIDEKIMIQVQKVGESVEDIQEKFQNLVKNTDLHKLEEISELSLQEKKERIKSLRKTTVTLAEKLSQNLFNLDQLVGSSEKVRPYKKKQVNTIQSILGQVDQISDKLKDLESELKVQEEQQRQKDEEERLRKEQEERKKHEELERQRREKQLKEMKEMEEKYRLEKERLEKERLERERLERERRENFDKHMVHQPNVQRLSPLSNEKQILVNKRNEENKNKIGNLPLPTKEHWRKLKYDAEFEVKKLPNKYHLQSYIPNLNIEELKIVEKDNLLSISGTRYPTEQEEKLLVQKLLNWLKHYSSSIQDWTESDFTRAILKVGSGSFGTFNVSYSLPDDYDQSKNINASYNRGVLEIEVPIVSKRKYVHPFFANNYGGFDNFW